MRHRNPSFAEAYMRQFNLKGNDQASDEVAGFITPTVELAPLIDTFGANTLTNTTSAIVLTAPTGKDLYLTDIDISYSGDATATATSLSVLVTINGVQRSIIRMRRVPSVANADSRHVSFTVPLKLDRGTSMYISSDTGTANIACSVFAYGYTIEVTR